MLLLIALFKCTFGRIPMQRTWRPSLSIKGIVGNCGAQEVFMGFADAGDLYRTSFADVLDEETGRGYQRRFSEAHSLEFRKYIQCEHATTIPLTFNLRPTQPQLWRIVGKRAGSTVLEISETNGPVFAQVDCQHRLGFLKGVNRQLAFMTFLGLSPRQEMDVFSIINSKAKGLSSSLLDYHESKLTEDLSELKPEIYLALRLHETQASPWYRRLDLGGNKSVGMRRYASLRTMQKAIRRFLRSSQILASEDVDATFRIILAFWRAVTHVLEVQWHDSRKHFVTKGVGVYALMSIAGDLYQDARRLQLTCDEHYFVGVLSDFM